ncbi:hypothetical protein GGI21_006576, partial [Coemansia aciculifera]
MTTTEPATANAPTNVANAGTAAPAPGAGFIGAATTDTPYCNALKTNLEAMKALLQRKEAQAKASTQRTGAPVPGPVPTTKVLDDYVSSYPALPAPPAIPAIPVPDRAPAYVTTTGSSGNVPRPDAPMVPGLGQTAPGPSAAGKRAAPGPSIH